MESVKGDRCSRSRVNQPRVVHAHTRVPHTPHATRVSRALHTRIPRVPHACAHLEARLEPRLDAIRLDRDRTRHLLRAARPASALDLAAQTRGEPHRSANAWGAAIPR
eukprot:2027626-Rhodomonas_salina.2